jgi:hypothetical protein
MQKIVVLQTPKSSNVGHLLSSRRIEKMVSDTVGFEQGGVVSLHPEQSRRQESFQHCFPDIRLMDVEVAVRLRRWQETGLASSLWDLRETLTSLEFSLISTSAE